MEPRENQFAWSEARNLCTAAGGDLVSIPNRAVNDALIGKLSSVYWYDAIPLELACMLDLEW